MGRLALLLSLGAVSGGLTACGGGDDGGTGADKPAAATSENAPRKDERQLGTPAAVPGQANIFGAGREETPPSPGGGGPGVKPPAWRLPEGSNRVVTIPSATGRVNSIVDVAKPNGPEGDGAGNTDVYSWHGISGIVHRRNGMFLVGVFLGDGEPKSDAPRRLHFFKRERLKSLAPRIGQTFLIGDGKGRSFEVPSDATRLFLGFVDGYYYTGNPGWYDNNGGKLSVTVEMTSG